MNKEGGVSQLTDCSLRKDQKEGTRRGNCFLGIFALSIQIVCTIGLTGSLASLANHVKLYNAGNKRVIQHFGCLQGRLMAHAAS